jgi:hypothetical protein
MAARCSFCGATSGPSGMLEGLFTVLVCGDCQAARGHGSGPYPVMTRAELRAGLDLLPTWALGQKAATNPRGQCGHAPALGGRRGGGSHVPGARLERQAEVAEELVARRKPTEENRPRIMTAWGPAAARSQTGEREDKEGHHDR